MSLWKNTDAVASRPTWINLANYPAGTQLVFVDATEAVAASNKNKGFTGAGWYLYREYKDSNGDVRYKTELVVSMAVTAAIAGDAADDAVVPDVDTTVIIVTQPEDAISVSGSALFSVVASIEPTGTPTYQWQTAAAGSKKFVDLAGETSASLTINGVAEEMDGTKYRVQVAGFGAKTVTSEVATLVFGS